MWEPEICWKRSTEGTCQSNKVPKALSVTKRDMGPSVWLDTGCAGAFAVTIADAQALPKDLSAVTANADLANLLWLRRNFRKSNHREKQTADNFVHNYVAYKPHLALWGIHFECDCRHIWKTEDAIAQERGFGKLHSPSIFFFSRCGIEC